MSEYDAGRPQPYRPYGHPPPMTTYELALHRRPLRRWSSRIGVGLLLVQALMMCVSALLVWVFYNPTFFDLGQEHIGLIQESIQLVSHAVAFWVPTLILVIWIKIPPRVAFPLRLPKASILLPAVLVSLGASVVGSILTNIVAIAFEQGIGLTPTMPDMSMPQGVAARIVYCISMVISPAIFEELMFRGVVLQSLRRFGDGFALVVSSILFGFIHGNLIQGPHAILLGLVIGYFVLRTGSIITGIVIHAVINGLSTVFTFAMEAMNTAQIEMLNAATFGAYAVLGCVGLIYLVVRHGGLFRLAPSDNPLPTAKKYTAFFTTVAQILFFIVTVVLTCSFFA